MTCPRAGVTTPGPIDLPRIAQRAPRLRAGTPQCGMTARSTTASVVSPARSRGGLQPIWVAVGPVGKGRAVCLWLVVRHHRFVECFLDDDAGYLRWLAEHPGLFVLNAYRTPTPVYLILHRAGCRSITELPAGGRHWTTDYRKVCGSRTELEQYAREKVGGHPKSCGHCL